MRTRLRSAVVVTVLVGLALAATSLVVARSPEQRDEVDMADRAAAQLTRRLATWQDGTRRDVVRTFEADRDDYPGLLKVVDQRIASAPDVVTTGTTAYGRKHSGAYRGSGEKRRLVMAPFVTLAAELRDRAIPQSSFVRAGKKLTRLSPARLLGDTPVTSGDPLRELVLPAYEKARATMRRQVAPDGAALLLADLNRYASDVVAMTRRGAARIDDGKSFFFSLGQRPTDLYRRVQAVEADVATEVSGTVDTIGADQ